MPFMSFGGGQRPPDSYLFVDGNCLTVTLKNVADRYFGGASIPVDFAALKAGHKKVYYYDAVPVRGYTEDADTWEKRTAAKRDELSHIARQPGYHVRAGDARARKGRGVEQKMVDVQLAVDMMALGGQGIFGRAVLLTGDLDFKPLVEALVAMGVDLTLQYPMGETNGDLIEAADSAQPLHVSQVTALSTDAFRRANPLPVPCNVFKQEAPIGPPMHQWTDARFGGCVLSERDGVFDMLATEADGGPSETHRLQVRSERLAILRLFCEDRFGIKIPV